MKVDKTEISVSPATHNPATGEKLEPEERPAQLTVHTGVALHVGGDPRTLKVGGAPMSIPGIVSVDMFAGEVAESMRKRCADCVYFDRAAWIILFKQWRVGTYEQQQMLNALRATASQVNDEEYNAKHMEDEQGEIDLEHALQAMGICHALTDYWTPILGSQLEALTIMDPACGCPDEFGPDQTYLGGLFKPRDTGAEKRGAQRYDKLLGAAQGRAPTVKPKT